MRSVGIVIGCVSGSLSCGDGSPTSTPSIGPSSPAEPTTIPLSCTAAPADLPPLPYRFEVEHTVRNHGRDAGTSTTRGVFDGESVVLTGPVAPCVRNRCDEATVRWFLTISERDELVAQLKDDLLWGDTVYEEASPLPHAHVTRTTRLVVTHHADTATSRVQYSKSRTQTDPIPPEVRALEAGVNQLLSLLRSQARRCHPSFRLGA